MTRFAVLLILLSFYVACTPNDQQVGRKTTKKYVQPTNGYAQMVVVQQGLQKTLYISGQVGDGDNLDQQMRNALKAIQELLQSENADFKDLVKINSYIVDYQPEDLDVFRDVRQDIFGSDVTPASTLVGVQALALPEWLIEIDAIAIIDSE